MENLHFSNSADGLSGSAIESVEARLGMELPEDYKVFLLETNGGKPDKIFFEANGSEYVLNEFLPFSNSSFSFEQYFLDFKVNRHLLPKNLAPIADDAFGNLICLSFGRLDYGYIYFWDHETAGEPRFIAKSFHDFLRLLHNDND